MFKGALVSFANGQMVPNEKYFNPIWNTVIYDEGEFFNGPSPEFVIPEGVSLVRLSTVITWFDGGGILRMVSVCLNGDQESVPHGFYLSAKEPTKGNFPMSQPSWTAPFKVVPGDKLSVQIYQDSGAELELNSNELAWFGIEALG